MTDNEKKRSGVFFSVLFAVLLANILTVIFWWFVAKESNGMFLPAMYAAPFHALYLK